MILPEYGRHVQMMVQHAVLIKDRDERNVAAHTIIGVMGNLQPHLRDIPDFKHKLWDHLYIMSNFKLDIDSPYPVPSLKALAERPHNVPYPQAHIRQKHYGKYLVDMIKEAAKMEDSELRMSLLQSLASQMKKTYIAWNRSEVNNEQIIQDIWDISNGVITLNPDSFHFSDQPKDPGQQSTNRTKKKKVMAQGSGRR